MVLHRLSTRVLFLGFTVFVGISVYVLVVTHHLKMPETDHLYGGSSVTHRDKLAVEALHHLLLEDFSRYDLDRDNRLSVHEFAAMLRDSKQRQAEVEAEKAAAAEAAAAAAAAAASTTSAAAAGSGNEAGSSSQGGGGGGGGGQQGQQRTEGQLQQGGQQQEELQRRQEQEQQQGQQQGQHSAGQGQGEQQQQQQQQPSAGQGQAQAAATVTGDDTGAAGGGGGGAAAAAAQGGAAAEATDATGAATTDAKKAEKEEDADYGYKGDDPAAAGAGAKRADGGDGMYEEEEDGKDEQGDGVLPYDEAETDADDGEEDDGLEAVDYDDEIRRRSNGTSDYEGEFSNTGGTSGSGAANGSSLPSPSPSSDVSTTAASSSPSPSPTTASVPSPAPSASPSPVVTTADTAAATATAVTGAAAAAVPANTSGTAATGSSSDSAGAGGAGTGAGAATAAATAPATGASGNVVTGDAGKSGADTAAANTGTDAPAINATSSAGAAVSPATAAPVASAATPAASANAITAAPAAGASAGAANNGTSGPAETGTSTTPAAAAASASEAVAVTTNGTAPVPAATTTTITTLAATADITTTASPAAAANATATAITTPVVTANATTDTPAASATSAVSPAGNGTTTAVAPAAATSTTTATTAAPATTNASVAATGGGCPELSKELVGRFARQNTIMLTVADWRIFGTMGINWMKHLAKWGVDYYLVGATDAKTAQFLGHTGKHSCFKFYEDGAHKGSDEYRYGDTHYNAATWRKVVVVSRIVHWGFNVLHSDVDVVWFRDPLPYFLGPALRDVDVAVSSDLISTQNPPGDDGLEVGMQQHTNFNTGVYFVRASPGGQSFMAGWSSMRSTNVHENDQVGVYEFIRQRPSRNTPRVLVLQPKEEEAEAAARMAANLEGFKRVHKSEPLPVGSEVRLGGLGVHMLLNGYSYFIPRLHERMNVTPLGVHMTWVPLSKEGKFHRFRDGMLYDDPPEYYDAPDLRFLTADIDAPDAPEGFNQWRETEDMIQVHLKNMPPQLQQVYRAVAVSLVLNRTLIFPRLRCYCFKNWFMSEQCRIPGDKVTQFPLDCALDQIFRPKVLYNYPPLETKNGLQNFTFREYSLLDNPRTPKEVKEGQVLVVPEGADAGNTTGFIRVVRVKPNLMQDDLVKALEEVKDAKVLRLRHPLQLFGGFSDQVLQASVAKFTDAVTANWCCRDEPYIKRGLARKVKMVMTW